MRTAELTMIVPGAKPAELERGVAAAWKVFQEEGVEPRHAARAALAWERWSLVADPIPSEEVRRAAAVWVEARSAALEACCCRWVPSAIAIGLTLSG